MKITRGFFLDAHCNHFGWSYERPDGIVLFFKTRAAARDYVKFRGAE
jgi:hypothetical protein